VQPNKTSAAHGLRYSMRNVRTRRECALARLRRAAPLAALSYSLPLALRTARSSCTCTARARGALEISPLCFPDTTRWSMAAPTNRLRAPRARCGTLAVTRSTRQTLTGTSLAPIERADSLFCDTLRCASLTPASCACRALCRSSLGCFACRALCLRSRGCFACPALCLRSRGCFACRALCVRSLGCFACHRGRALLYFVTYVTRSVTSVHYRHPRL